VDAAAVSGGGVDATPASSIERLVVSMARSVADDDVAVVGVGTPVALAAFLLARALHAPHLRIMMPGALDPVPTALAAYLRDPVTAVAGARARMSRVQILDAIARGDVTIQFVRPAQVDGQLRLNTEMLSTPAGVLHLVGPVALPDVVARVGRVVAYLPRHDRSSLVARVDAVTAPRGAAGGTVAGVLTPLAHIRLVAGSPSVAARTDGVAMAEIRELTGFHIGAGEAPTMSGPSRHELHALRSAVDPLRLIGLEDADLRQEARMTLARLWSTAAAAEAAP
jgi:glutaconate CoA-transferase subunit B